MLSAQKRVAIWVHLSHNRRMKDNIPRKLKLSRRLNLGMDRGLWERAEKLGIDIPTYLRMKLVEAVELLESEEEQIFGSLGERKKT